MNKWVLLLVALGFTVATHGQGQVVFANKVGTAVDAPVTLFGNVGPVAGPGPSYSAQLLLVGLNGSLTPLAPATTFRTAGMGAAAIADRYWNTQTVDVPVQPGTEATFVVRAWFTSAGSYDATSLRGESAPFTVTVGGGTLPPANLTSLRAFQVFNFPEPSTIALGVLGSAMFLMNQRRRL